MTDLRQAAQAVVERWDTPAWEWRDQGPTADLMADLRTALEQPEQEPCIGKDPRCPCQDGDACHYKDCVGTKARPVAQPEQEPVAKLFGTLPVFDTPPAAQRPWQGLTDDEIDSCWYQSGGITPGFARTVEAKLKEKNDH